MTVLFWSVGFVAAVGFAHVASLLLK